MSVNVNFSKVDLKKGIEISIYLIFIIPLLVYGFKNGAGIYHWFMSIYHSPVSFTEAFGPMLILWKFCFLFLTSFSLAILFIHLAIHCYLEIRIDYPGKISCRKEVNYFKKAGKVISLMKDTIISVGVGFVPLVSGIAIAYNVIKGYSVIEFGEFAWYIHLIIGSIATVFGGAALYMLTLGFYYSWMIIRSSLGYKVADLL